jgi:regulatory protein
MDASPPLDGPSLDGQGEPLAGRVTALEPQARDPERVNLFLEGRFAFGLSAAVAAEAGLRVGVVLTGEAVAALLRQEASEQALQQALLLLSYRPRSEREIRRALQQKGHAPETAEGVVARLRDLHYLDDEAFALSWVENRQRFRPRGARLLRAELRQKGVAPETTDQAIADAGGDERALALAAAEKRAAGLEAADYPEFGRKVGGFLSRRGFAPDVVWEVVRELWTARSGESAPPPD